MYLEKLKLLNFRKFKNLEIKFNEWLNLFVGPNDSGKTSVIDALKLVLWTASNDYFKIQETDFYDETNNLKIEAFITNFTEFQSAQLLDWWWLDDNWNFCLKVIFESIKTTSGFHTTIKAWTYKEDDWGSYLEPIVKDYIKSVYLKPLRNAEIELSSWKNSRLSQILLSHPSIKKTDINTPHELEEKFKDFRDNILNPYFDSKDIKDDINWIFEKLLEKDKWIKWDITINSSTIDEIVKSLSLLVENSKNKKAWLGTSNLLLIAAELLLLDKLKWSKLWCALIEEIEAHIHPQWQLRLINFLEEKSSELQLFLTSHSPNIASKLDIKNIFIFRDDKIFPMSDEYTALEEKDYKHLKRFLDVTKANLFFAKWLIFVEWIAEALLIPEIAKILWYDLNSHGISIINVNWISFDRYLNAFERKKWPDFNIKISVITDRDFKWINFEIEEKVKVNNSWIIPPEFLQDNHFQQDNYIEKLIDDKKLDSFYWNNITIDKKYYSKLKTLEYDMWLSCLKDYLLSARKKISSIQNEKELITDETNEYRRALNLYKRIKNYKGETAQELAEILWNLSETEINTLKAEIEWDIYLKYIVDAIKNVTE